MILLIIIPPALMVVDFLIGKEPKGNALIDEKLLATYKTILNTHVEFYQKLDAEGKVKFERLISEFLQYIHIEGVGTLRRVRLYEWSDAIIKGIACQRIF